MKNFILFAVAVIVFLACADAYAHPPSEIKIEYNSSSRMLAVIVTHPVSNPEKHFINKIDVWLNGEEIIEHKISRQDNEKYQLTGYLIPDAKPGDVIAVEAYCSVSGKLKQEIEVE